MQHNNAYMLMHTALIGHHHAWNISHPENHFTAEYKLVEVMDTFCPVIILSNLQMQMASKQVQVIAIFLRAIKCLSARLHKNTRRWRCWTFKKIIYKSSEMDLDKHSWHPIHYYVMNI